MYFTKPKEINENNEMKKISKFNEIFRKGKICDVNEFNYINQQKQLS